jgi:hypothetical protein
MNCQFVNNILDNLRFDRIDPRRRRQVEAHAATCAECARAWNALVSLASLPDEPMPAGLRAQCASAVAGRAPAFTAARASGRHRLLKWGSLAALGAAAATLLILTGPEARTTPAGVEPEHEGALLNVEAGSAIAQRPSLVPASVDATPEPATQPINVLVVVREPSPDVEKAVNNIETDPLARDVLLSMRTALVAELRKVPVLVVTTEATEQFASTPYFRLQLGPLHMRGVDGRPDRKEGRYDMALDIEKVQTGGGAARIPVPMQLFAVEPRATCTSPDDAERMPCDAPTTAVHLVRKLRQQVFPADAVVTRPLQSRFKDFSLPPEERFEAFVELFRQQIKAGGRHLLADADVVRAAVEFSQLTDSGHRAQLWRAMRGVGDPLLIDPLLASLQQDPQEARVAAVETLAADFRDNMRARPALEAVAASDPSPMVRALARSALSGERAWQDFTVSSLKDPALPASQRVEALLHVLYPPDTLDDVNEPSPTNYWQVLMDLDDAAVRSLAEVFPRAEQLRKWPGNNLIGNFASRHKDNPAVKEMLLTVLAQDTRSSNRSVAGESLAQNHATDPRVRDALNRAVRSDPDAHVRDYLRQVLDRDYVKKVMEAAPR